MEFIEQIIEMILIGIGILGLVLLATFAYVVVVVPIHYIITRKERNQLLDEIKAAGGKLNQYLSKLESDSAQPLKVKKSINYNEDENEMPLSFVITEDTNLLFLVNWKSHLTFGIG